MTIFKCKMCGGALEINNNETVATCEYCGTQQTLPKLDDDKRVNIYDRANHFRRNKDVDSDDLPGEFLHLQVQDMSYTWLCARLGS